MKHFIVLAWVSLVGICQLGLAKSYIVLFKEAEISIASMQHGAFQNLLQTSNQKNVEQLKNWMGSRGIQSNVSDLWISRAAALTLDEEGAKKLAHEAWVKGVYEDKVRTWVAPAPDIMVANSLKELGGDTWGLEKIGVNKIHTEFPELDGSGVRVGIVDTGIQSRHQELGNKKVIFKDFVNNISSPYDDQGHGTHVAGTISGNKVGIASEASLVFAKSFSAGGSTSDSGLITAMQWIFDPDNDPSTNDFPQVVNNSWGGELEEDVIYNIDAVAPFVRAIQTWIHGGIIPVFAAGNSGKSPNGFPGGLPEPISIGAISLNGELAAFSSRGPNLWKIGESVITLLKPDVSAPGDKIVSAYPGNKYASMAGTSMATPHVTGSIALALQANPKLKFSDVKTLLLKSADKKMDTQFGYGILNAYEFIKLAKGK